MAFVIPEGALVCFLDERDDEKSMLVGGFYIPRRRLRDLDYGLSDLKRAYGLREYDTVKWNLRDPACANAKKQLTGKVDNFREDLFDFLPELDCRLIMSLVWKGDPTYRTDAWKWAFENILQRLCIVLDRKRKELTEEHEYPVLDVVFDWFPSTVKIDEYFNVYFNAYYEGYKFADNILPSLKNTEACPCLLVSSVRFSPALQITDMVLGAVGDFFTWVFRQERERSVERHFANLYRIFHRDERDTVLGCGLVVNRNTRLRIENNIRELGLEP